MTCNLCNSDNLQLSLQVCFQENVSDTEVVDPSQITETYYQCLECGHVQQVYRLYRK